MVNESDLVKLRSLTEAALAALRQATAQLEQARTAFAATRQYLDDNCDDHRVVLVALNLITVKNGLDGARAMLATAETAAKDARSAIDTVPRD